MNLLFLTYQGDMAGSTNSIAYLSEGLANKGHRVVVGCRQASLLYELLSGTKVILYPMTFKSKVSSASLRQIRKAVKDFDIHIINAQSSKDRYLAIFARWWYRLPVKVVHTRRQTPKSAGGRLQNWFYWKGTDKIVVISDELKKTFVKKGIPAHHIAVIYNGIPAEKYSWIDPQEVAALRKKFGLSSEDKVIGCVSRLKNQAQIIQALPYLDKNIKVLFVGIEAGTFDELVQQLGIQQTIIYAGKVSPNEVMNYYPLMTVNILASTTDGFGLVLVEAMGAKTPVIGTRYEGIIDVLDNQKNGLWFEDGNIEELVEKIKVVLYNETVRQQLVEQGYKAATERFTMERTILNYEIFFQQLLEH